MPEFTRAEHDDQVSPELFQKTPVEFVPGQRLRVTVRNYSAMQCGPLAHECPLSFVLDGEVLRRPLWADQQSLALYVFESDVRTRVIRLRDIEAINGRRYRFADSLKGPAVQQWRVQGSKGNEYIVTYDYGSWNCTCPGFKYHGNCKHVKEKQDA